MKIYFFILLSACLLCVGCADLQKSFEIIQAQYSEDTVINIPGSSDQFLVVKKNGTIIYIETNNFIKVNTIRCNIELYRNRLTD